jgi:flagellar protein FliL
VSGLTRGAARSGPFFPDRTRWDQPDERDSGMTDDERDMSTPSTPPPAKKGKGRLIVVVLILLVLGGGAGGGAWWWMARSQAASGHDGGHGAVSTESGVLALEQFTVNLADEDASRFLRATVHLVIDKGDEVKEIEENKLQLIRVRSSVLELLTMQTSARVTTTEGKTELKHAIAARTSDILKPIKVIDVLFSDFVVQF